MGKRPQGPGQISVPWGTSASSFMGRWGACGWLQLGPFHHWVNFIHTCRSLARQRALPEPPLPPGPALGKGRAENAEDTACAPPRPRVLSIEPLGGPAVDTPGRRQEVGVPLCARPGAGCRSCTGRAPPGGTAHSRAVGQVHPDGGALRHHASPGGAEPRRRAGFPGESCGWSRQSNSRSRALEASSLHVEGSRE